MPTRSRAGVFRDGYVDFPPLCEYCIVCMVLSLYSGELVPENRCVCGVGGFPEFTWCNGMKPVVTMMRTYMIQSKLEPLRAVAALLEDWVAGEEDWYP